jgi:hypothetical protein
MNCEIQVMVVALCPHCGSERHLEFHQVRPGVCGICAGCGNLYAVGNGGLVKVSKRQEAQMPKHMRDKVRRDRMIWRKIFSGMSGVEMN